MKKKIVVYVLMAFIALFLIFRFVSISNNISLQRGIVRSVSATEHNDIVIELENDSFYYINRGMESEINYEWFQNYLPGHEIELYIQNEHLFGSNSNRIVEVSINDYVEIVDSSSLEKVEEINKSVLVAIAVFIGKTRLIDNFTYEL